MNARRRLLAPPVVLAFAVAGVALAGCGGSGGGPSGEDGAGPTMTRAATTVPASTTTGGAAAPAPGAADAAPEGVVSYAGLSQDHTTDAVSYPEVPPVGGPHNPRWQTCGFYDQPIQTEKGVHSMEHGAVWVTYTPDLPADQVSVLEGLVAGRTHVLVSPFAGLPAPVVASAWGKQLVLQSATDPRLAQFVAYYEQGPQTPEPGAPC